ncbi:MAG: hypothetical protein ABIO91_07995 [Pyrinomonadaceae bacterium]
MQDKKITEPTADDSLHKPEAAYLNEQAGFPSNTYLTRKES